MPYHRLLLQLLVSVLPLSISTPAYCWGFFAHKQINYYAVFLLPPEMLIFYKPNIAFLAAHAVDPDKRRYMVAAEGPRHFIDLDLYGKNAPPGLPQQWDRALACFSADSLNRHGIVPWWIQTMLQRLTSAFRAGDAGRILKLSAEIGHYIADAHVPLHASSNHNGQLSNQAGIHGFWESRIPELLADREWEFFIGRATYLSHPSEFIWKRVYESAAAADTVLRGEKKLSEEIGSDRKYAYEERNGLLVRQYAEGYSRAYDALLHGMVQRRMRASVFAVASFWYTAWINAGQPDLRRLSSVVFSPSDSLEFRNLDLQWKKGRLMDDRPE
jgi:hypothetical protein